MRISEFSHKLGLSKDTVRRLELRGLISPQRDWAGHRRYSEEDVRRARQTLFKRRRGIPALRGATRSGPSSLAATPTDRAKDES